MVRSTFKSRLPAARRFETLRVKLESRRGPGYVRDQIADARFFRCLVGRVVAEHAEDIRRLSALASQSKAEVA